MSNETRKPSFYNYRNGVISEEKAEKYLKKQGYKIIKNRYKSHYGEIDIIAQYSCLDRNILENGLSFKKNNKILVFFEVKSRKTDELIESILRVSQVKRIKNCALHFLSQNPQYEDYDIRFDFILFDKSQKMTHYEQYF